MTEQISDAVIQPLESEKKIAKSNVMELLPLNKDMNMLPSLNTALMNTSANGKYSDNMTSEHETAYRRADLLRRAANRHSWTRAAVMTISRSAIGSGFSITRHPVYGNVTAETKIEEATSIPELQKIYDFFYGIEDDDVRYIQDLQTSASKMMYSITSLVLYGQVAWEIIRDKEGNPKTFEVLPGYIFPNIDEKGKFLKPAYYFRPWNSNTTYPLKKAKDIIFITWPGTDYSVLGSTEFTAVAESSIPSDLYASAVYRSHFENINSPFNGFWVVDPTTSDEDFDKFIAMVFNRYTGVRNFGRNPIVVRGNAEFKEIRSRSNDDAPYLEGRRYNQEEISAVTGVSSSKLGLGSNVNRTNFREQRRDFWETTLRPLYAIVEEAIYRQVFVRLFGLKEWHLTFNRPDLTTALEQATIDARYLQNGVINPNEARANIKLPPRTDPLGFAFYDPIVVQMGKQDPGLMEYDNQSSSNERANEGESDRSQDMQRPPTSDRPQNEEPGANKSLSELRRWKKFTLNVLDNKRRYRSFNTEYIESSVADEIEDFILDNMDDRDEIKLFFDLLIENVIQGYQNLTND